MSTFMYKGRPLNEPGNVDFGSTDISGIGDGTVTGAIKNLHSNITFDKYETPTFETIRCSGSITHNACIIWPSSGNGRTLQIGGRIIILGFTRTDGNPGVRFQLPFTPSVDSPSICVGYRQQDTAEVALIRFFKDSNWMEILTSETYTNPSNGTLTLVVPLTTIYIP